MCRHAGGTRFRSCAAHAQPMIVAPTCVTAPGHSNSCSRTCDLTLEELKVVLQQVPWGALRWHGRPW